MLTGQLLSQFERHFPALAPLIVHAELSTPLSSVAFTAAEHGGIYGLEASPRRFLSTALRAKTPVAGLYLTGQDVGSTGIVGAMMGGACRGRIRAQTVRATELTTRPSLWLGPTLHAEAKVRRRSLDMSQRCSAFGRTGNCNDEAALASRVTPGRRRVLAHQGLR